MLGQERALLMVMMICCPNGPKTQDAEMRPGRQPQRSCTASRSSALVMPLMGLHDEGSGWQVSGCTLLRGVDITAQLTLVTSPWPGACSRLHFIQGYTSVAAGYAYSLEDQHWRLVVEWVHWATTEADVACLIS